MYSFDLLRELNYNYDADAICCDKFYKLHLIGYIINESLYAPFIEFFLTKKGFPLYISQEEEYLTPKSLNSYIVSFKSIIENNGLNGRYQGYHCNDNEIYFLFRLSHIDNNKYLHQIYDMVSCTIYDIMVQKKHFSTLLNKHIIDYITFYKKKYQLYDIFNKKIVDVIPETIYTNIENIAHNIEYIKKYCSQYHMRKHGPVLQLKDQSCGDVIPVKNIVFNKEKILSFKQILSVLEK